MSDKLEKAEKRIAELEKEVRVAQEMLYQVLNAIGEPVVVTGDDLKAGVVGDQIIDANYVEAEDVWVFTLVAVQ